MRSTNLALGLFAVVRFWVPLDTLAPDWEKPWTLTTRSFGNEGRWLRSNGPPWPGPFDLLHGAAL